MATMECSYSLRVKSCKVKTITTLSSIRMKQRHRRCDYRFISACDPAAKQRRCRLSIDIRRLAPEPDAALATLKAAALRSGQNDAVLLRSWLEWRMPKTANRNGTLPGTEY